MVATLRDKDAEYNIEHEKVVRLENCIKAIQDSLNKSLLHNNMEMFNKDRGDIYG